MTFQQLINIIPKKLYTIQEKGDQNLSEKISKLPRFDILDFEEWL